MNKLGLCVRWPGSKYRLAEEIIKRFPEHDVYVEVFGGGAGVMFQKEPSKLEIYNDIDSNLVNFFRVLKDPEKAAVLHDMLRITPHSREIFYEYRDNIKSGKQADEITRAYWWYYVNLTCVSGVMQSWSFTTKNNVSLSVYYNHIAKIPLFTKRFESVQIENNDFAYILDKYDSEKTLFYVDPPYVTETRTERIYKHEMATDRHTELLAKISAVRGKVILSGYQNDLYDKSLAGWYSESFNVSMKMGINVGGNRVNRRETDRTEVLWMNYVPRIDLVNAMP